MPDLLQQLLGKIVQGVPNSLKLPAPTGTPSKFTQPSPLVSNIDQTPLQQFVSKAVSTPSPDVESIKQNHPLLSAIGGAVGGFLTNTAKAADKFTANTSSNLHDFFTGKLKVTPADVAQGGYDTALGVGKLAQGFNAGILRIGKSIEATLPGYSQLPQNGDSLTQAVTGEPTVGTYQQLNQKVNDWALSHGATPTQAKTTGAIAVIGSLFLDNPVTGGEGKAVFNLSEDAIKQLAKEGTEEGATKILVESGVDAAKAKALAPVFTKATTEGDVRNAIRYVNQGADAAQKVVSGDLPERGFISNVKRNIPALTDRVSGYYIPRETDALSMKAANLVKDDEKQALLTAFHDTSDKGIATASELIKHYNAQAESAVSKEAKDMAYQKAADVANNVARTLTEAGRTVQAASIVGRLTPEGQVRFAAREIQRYNEGVSVAKQVPELSGAQAEQLLEKAKQVQSLPDGIEKKKAFMDLQNDVADLVPTPLYKKIISVWKAGLLTGLKTSGINTASNLFHGISEVAKDAPGALVDSVASLVTGKRTLTLTARGTLQGGSEGLRKGWTYFRTGFDERDVARGLDVNKISFGTSPVAKAIQGYEEAVFRAMGAEDQPFYYGAKAHSLYSQAIAEAKTQGLTGAVKTDFINKSVANPTDEMIHNATLDAQMAVFQNDTALGDVASAIARKMPAAEVVIPFRRTPAAILMQMINYTPAGIVKEIATQINRKEFNQRIFSQAAGRAITGTGLLYLGGVLYDKGLISLGRSTSEVDQKEQQLEGGQQNAIKVGKSWRQVGVLGPLGIELLIGGAFRQALEKTGSVFGAMTQSSATMGQALIQQTFLSGLNSFIDALNDPTRYAEGLFKGLAGSVVPTIVADIARATDSSERRSESVSDAVKARIPGVRETLQPQVNVFGQNVKTPGFLEVMADPTRPTFASDDPAVQELARLSKAGFKVAPTQLGTTKGYSSLTPAENTKLWKGVGQLIHSKLTSLFQDQRYQNLDDDGKSKIISKFTSQAGEVGRASMLLYKTRGLSGDALKQELSRQKKGGLLTKSVFSLYEQMK